MLLCSMRKMSSIMKSYQIPVELIFNSVVFFWCMQRITIRVVVVLLVVVKEEELNHGRYGAFVKTWRKPRTTSSEKQGQEEHCNGDLQGEGGRSTPTPATVSSIMSSLTRKFMGIAIKYIVIIFFLPLFEEGMKSRHGLHRCDYMARDPKRYCNVFMIKFIIHCCRWNRFSKFAWLFFV